ncbi:MAG: DUF2231 domain-containing protein [Acidimicrobiales bacterium]|nr:DUF2231 domain-containing protein [Acidimicrobiales bacterium]
MYSKVRIAGHPLHPMLVAYPVAFYTGALAGFAVYAANNHQFWLNLAIALSVAGAGGAILAALPGAVDLMFGVPRSSQAKRVGVAHGLCNVTALGLFIAAAASYADNWNGPPISATLGLALSAAGVFVTVIAGALGWMLVQTYHVGIELTARQAEDELTVQQAHALHLVHHRRAS